MINLIDRLSLDQRRAVCAMQLDAPEGLRPSPIIGCGGMGGAGKTFTLLSAFAYGHLVHVDLYGLERMPPSCIIADTIPNLKDRLVGPANRDFAGMFRFVDSHSVHGRCLLFKDEKYGAIWLRHAEELDTLRGKEVWGLGVEETSTFPERHNGEFILDLLEYPIRTPEPVRCHPMMFAFNWDGIGVPWLRRCFWPEDAKPDEDGKIEGRDADRFVYVPYDLASHPNREFAERQIVKLSGYQGAMRESRLHGRPGVPTGALFPAFSRGYQTFKFQERFPSGLPFTWRKFIGLDWGIADPYCALWVALDELGNMYVYREDYRAGLLEEHQAQSIVMLTGINELIESVYYDPSMDHQYHRKQKRSQPVIYAYKEILGDDKRFGGMSWGDNSSRIQAWRTIASLLNHHPSSISPNLYIEEGCRSLIAELEGAKYKTISGVWCDDMDERLPDHALTALAYVTRRIMGQKSVSDRGFGSLNISDHAKPNPFDQSPTGSFRI